jgi:peptide/nickel transport system permease protein
MVRFIIVRLLQVPPLLVFISVIVFVVTALTPGDPAISLLGAEATPDQLATLRHDMGLDRPMLVRYGVWLGDVVQGDLGRSYLSKRPALDLIRSSFPITLEVTLIATLIGLLIAVPAGIISAVKRNSKLDMAATLGAYAGLSFPSFWLAILMIYLFALRLGWLPASGYVSFRDDPVAHFKSLTMPTLALGVLITAQLTRYLRAGVLDVLHEAYVTTARSKGLNERAVIMRHAVRNALIPFVTVLGLQIGRLLGGTVIIEQIFAIPGMGQLAINSIISRDYPVVQAIVLVSAVVFVFMNLFVDLLYGFLDPRIRTAR